MTVSAPGGERAETWSARVRPIAAARTGPGIAARLKRDWVLLLIALPGLAYFLIFYYVPLLGYVIAFENYQPFLGFFNSPFVGFNNFVAMARDSQFWQAVGNTLVIALLQILLFFPAPIALALLLSSIISTRVRRFVQTVVYLPYFISWVIVVSLFQQLLGGDGVLTVHLAHALGWPTGNWMGNPDGFKWLVTAQLIWKDTGFGTIIYLAALLNIDASLYEAAAVDGANRWQRLLNVTLPGMVGVTVLLLVLRLGFLLSVGFEQILLQRDAVGPAAGEVLDTFVYYRGIVGGQWGVTAAANLIKGIVGVVLVLSANKVAHLFGQPGVYQ
jgi:putative aldouronate transport system permease protein